MKSIHHEKNGYNLNLDMLTISCVSYPRRSGLVGENSHLGAWLHSRVPSHTNVVTGM